MPKLTTQEKKTLSKTRNWRENVKRKTPNRNTYSKRLNHTRKRKNNALRLKRKFINEDEVLTLLKLKRIVLFFRALERLGDEKALNIKEKLCHMLPRIESKIGTFNSFNKPIMGVKPGCSVYFSAYTDAIKSIYQKIMRIYEEFAENHTIAKQQRMIDIEDKYSELASDLYKVINHTLKPKNNNNNENKNKNRISFNDIKKVLEEIAKEEPMPMPAPAAEVRMEEEGKNNNGNNNNENNNGKSQQDIEVDMLEDLFKRIGM